MLQKLRNSLELSPNTLLLVLSIAAFTVMSFKNYLLFHTGIELFSIVIAFCITIISINSYYASKNNLFVFLGIGYGFIGFFDLLHTMAYQGMNIFQGDSANLSTQLWLCARYIEAITIFLSSVLPFKHPKVKHVVAGYALVSTVLLLSIFHWHIFPYCFSPAAGLTHFKIISEYIISVLLLAAVLLLARNRQDLDHTILRYLLLAYGTSILTELSFTLYSDVYGIANMIGHIFKLLSFYFIYLALVKTNLTYPFIELEHVTKRLREENDERKRMEEELIKASKMESISALAGGIAHDFNNILTVVLGNASLAKFYVQDHPKALAKISEIETACRQATDLTQQLLTFSKGGEPIKQVVSVDVLIRETVGLALSGSNVLGEYTFAPDLYYAELDAGQIKQVLNNIVINACHAMPDGGVLEVYADNREVLPADFPGILNPGRYIRIALTDHGMGIAAENMPRIFDPFFTTKQKGHGLGLASCFSIVKRHQGHITVSSTVDVGTTFTIYLPASNREWLDNKVQQPSLNWSSNARILVMDDEEGIREILGKMANRIGCTVGYATDGNTAVKLYTEAQTNGKPYDAVILDLTIPGGMGGREAARKLLAIDPDVKLIISSGYAQDDNLFLKGTKNFLKKPYSFEELNQALYSLLMSKQST